MVLALPCMLAGSLLFADTLSLKSGETLVGTFSTGNQSEILFNTNGQMRRFSMREVRSLEFGPLPNNSWNNGSWNNGQRRWSHCNETAILTGCQPGGADAHDYEWHYAGGFWDGQVFDPNDDGILVMPPDNWYNPAGEDCAVRKGFCVQDMWDLDNDGDNQESRGECEDIQVCQ